MNGSCHMCESDRRRPRGFRVTTNIAACRHKKPSLIDPPGGISRQRTGDRRPAGPGPVTTALFDLRARRTDSPSGSQPVQGLDATVSCMDRRGFLLAVGVGTLGVLTACELSAAESGTALPAPQVPDAAPTMAAPQAPVTPVLQHGAPAVQRIAPPGTVVSWVPDTPPLLALTIDDGVSSPVVGAYVALAKATGIRLTFFANGVNHSWAEHQPEMQPLVDSGQIQIANHTWDHPDIRTLTDTQLVDQLDRNNRYLTGLYGVDTKP